MKVIESDNVPMMRRIFRHLQRRQSLLVTWQIEPASGKRRIFHSTLGSFQTEMKKVSLTLTENYELDSKLEIFFFAEDGQFIFKSNILQANGSHFMVEFPREIQLLDEPDALLLQGKSGLNIESNWSTKRLIVDGPEEFDSHVGKAPKAMSERTSRDQSFLSAEFNPSLDEEDKLFADKRESVRVRPKANKLVKLSVKGDENIHVLKLFDLSQGGMAFLTMLPEHFPKGSDVIVLGFGEFELDDPLMGTIMSHRSADDLGIEHKIGIKFIEGQE